MSNQQNKSLPKLKFKILIIGDSAVGKTSMLLKYVDNYFPESHMATIGVEYKVKTIKTPRFNIDLSIWDTAGQERFKSITRSFYNNTNGIVFVYDITSNKSFEGVKSWIKESTRYTKFESVLCGNKVDLKDKREVKIDNLKEYGLKKKMEIFETSAKDGTNIQEVFNKLVDLIIGDKSDEELIKEFGAADQTMSLSKSNKKKNQNSSGCCNK